MIILDLRRFLGKIIYENISLQRFYIFERSLPFKSDGMSSGITKNDSNNFSIRRLTLSSDDLLNQYMKFRDEVKKSEVLEWLSVGNMCLLAMNDEKIVGSLWITTKYYSFSEFKKVKLVLKDTANITKVFVLPQFRGKGIASKLIQNILQIINKEDIKKATAVVYMYNGVSIRFFSKFRFRIEHKLLILRIGSLRFHYLSKCKGPFWRDS